MARPTAKPSFFRRHDTFGRLHPDRSDEWFPPIWLGACDPNWYVAPVQVVIAARWIISSLMVKTLIILEFRTQYLG